MRALRLIPIVFVAAVVVGLPVAALTETRFELEAKDTVGLSHGCIAETNSSPGWREEASLPENTDEPRAVAVEDKIYTAGGIAEILFPEKELTGPDAQARVPVRSTRRFRRFDPATGRYANLPPLPEALNHLGMATYRGDVYVVGGHGNRLYGGDVQAGFFRYVISERRWERLAPLPTPRGAVAVGVLGDRLYVAGGMKAARPLGVPVDTLEAYDFGERRWIERAPMARPREHVSGAVAGGRLYVLGGRDQRSDALPYVESYDPAADRWRQEPPLLVPVGGLEAAGTPVGILALGGGNDRAQTITDAVQRFDPATRRWERRASMRTGRHGFASAFAAGRVYTFGGSPCALFAASDIAESYDPRR